MHHSGEFSFQVDRNDIGQRLDVVITAHIPGCSRAYASSLISEGSIQVHGARKKPGYRVKAGEAISALIPPPKPISAQPEPMDIDVVHEDDDLIVINKPPGLVVHPAPGNPTGTLVNGLLHHCPDLKGIGGEIRPGIVHRLDKDTSGILVVAKTASALTHLAHQFKTRQIQKTYLALVGGDVTPDTGRISLPIGRHPVDRKRMAALARARGKHPKKGRHREAETRWAVEERFEGACLLKLYPTTGRTHQLRVHCSTIGYPIIGDPVYGGIRARRLPALKNTHGDRLSANRQMLHAWKITFTHPASGEQDTFSAAPPQDMAELICALRFVGKGVQTL
ncbi:MAG: RluA family pseudouridine synthase [Desulfobacterales bacterium]